MNLLFNLIFVKVEYTICAFHSNACALRLLSFTLQVEMQFNRCFSMIGSAQLISVNKWMTGPKAQPMPSQLDRTHTLHTHTHSHSVAINEDNEHDAVFRFRHKPQTLFGQAFYDQLNHFWFCFFLKYVCEREHLKHAHLKSFVVQNIRVNFVQYQQFWNAERIAC